MTRTRAVLIALVVPLPVLALVWLVRKLSAWHADQERKLSVAWMTDHAVASALSESQAELDEPKPWARPRRVSEGPVSSYTRSVN